MPADLPEEVLTTSEVRADHYETLETPVLELQHNI